MAQVAAASAAGVAVAVGATCPAAASVAEAAAQSAAETAGAKLEVAIDEILSTIAGKEHHSNDRKSFIRKYKENFRTRVWPEVLENAQHAIRSSDTAKNIKSEAGPASIAKFSPIQMNNIDSALRDLGLEFGRVKPERATQAVTAAGCLAGLLIGLADPGIHQNAWLRKKVVGTIAAAAALIVPGSDMISNLAQRLIFNNDLWQTYVTYSPKTPPSQVQEVNAETTMSASRKHIEMQSIRQSEAAIIPQGLGHGALPSPS